MVKFKSVIKVDKPDFIVYVYRKWFLHQISWLLHRINNIFECNFIIDIPLEMGYTFEQSKSKPFTEITWQAIKLYAYYLRRLADSLNSERMKRTTTCMDVWIRLGRNNRVAIRRVSHRLFVNDPENCWKE